VVSNSVDVRGLFSQENLGTSNKLTEIVKCKSTLQLAFDLLLTT